MLLEYLKYTHYLSIDEFKPQDAEAKLRRALNAKQGEMNRQAGHFTEAIVGGVLNNFDKRSVDGEIYFGIAGCVKLPYLNHIQRRQGVIEQGHIHEIDVIGEYRLNSLLEGNAALGAWLVSVRYRKERMGEQEVQNFIKHAYAFQAEKQYGDVTLWYFSKAGFTEGAKKQLQQAGIYFSDLAQFNALADLFGLLPLSMEVVLK